MDKPQPLSDTELEHFRANHPFDPKDEESWRYPRYSEHRWLATLDAAAAERDRLKVEITLYENLLEDVRGELDRILRHVAAMREIVPTVKGR